jgi:hypothetical protein
MRSILRLKGVLMAAVLVAVGAAAAGALAASMVAYVGWSWCCSGWRWRETKVTAAGGPAVAR